MTTALTTSTAVSTQGAVTSTNVENTVARTIASIFQECLSTITDTRMDERYEHASLRFLFNLCLNARSHPCFGPLSNLNLHDKNACIKALLQVGEQLALMVHPSNFRYNVRVAGIKAKPIGMAEEKAITAYSLSIECFGKQYGGSTPKVYTDGFILGADHPAIYKNYQQTSDRMCIQNLIPHSIKEYVLYVPSIESTVAQSISDLFLKCFTTIPNERIQESRKDPLSFQFNMCENGESHPCFKPFDVENHCKFLLQVGRELTKLLKPSNFRYDIKVESTFSSPPFHSLIIECYEGTYLNVPKVYDEYRFCDENTLKLYQEKCNKIWVLQNGYETQFE